MSEKIVIIDNENILSSETPTYQIDLNKFNKYGKVYNKTIPDLNFTTSSINHIVFDAYKELIQGLQTQSTRIKELEKLLRWYLNPDCDKLALPKCEECEFEKYGENCKHQLLKSKIKQAQSPRIKELEEALTESKIVYYDENKNPIYENSMCSYTFDCDRGGLEYPCPSGCECTAALPVKYDIELGKYGLYSKKDDEWFYFDEIEDFNKLQVLQPQEER